MNERTGRCLCGAVTYRFYAEPVFTRVCWCTACQHIASNGTVNVLIPTTDLESSGALGEYLAIADSGNEIRRRFCPTCGSHLFATSSGRPQYTVVRVGTLDDPSWVRPTTNIWANSAPPWACLDTALERAEGQLPMPKTTTPR